MLQIEAIDLENAIHEASEKLGCSPDQVDYFVLQEPVTGIFGVGRKFAIIIASIKVSSINFNIQNEKKNITIDNKDDGFVQSLLEKKDDIFKNISKKIGFSKEKDLKESIAVINENQIVEEIKAKLTALLKATCFEIDTIVISLLNNETIFILLDGKDVPLLIGREGYRYKATLYLLSDWLSAKYNLKLQLEIGEFIKKQNEHIERYLENEVFHEIEKGGSFETKILDEVAVKLAIKKLRDKYKDKYVKVRNTQDGNKFIVIDEFFTKKI